MPKAMETGTQARPHRRAQLLGRGLAVALLLLAALSLTSAGPRLRPPRDRGMISRILAAGPHASDCETCHTAHGDAQPSPIENLLQGPNDNTLCQDCHSTPWSGGSFGGLPLYNGSAHGAGASTVWPGPEPPPRIELDAAGKCLNCHDPHGWTDAGGEIPQLTLQREEKLCLTCHDGQPSAADVNTDIRKPYRHPVTDFSGRHAGPAEGQPADFATAPLQRRHSECADCHNGHLARRDSPLGPAGTDASKAVLGASRVAVLNGPAGSTPGYTFIPGADTLSGARAEYELCFKCHSSWTTQPAGQTDLARVLNPSNPSFHPVESPGRNPSIAPQAFVPGWSPASITRCGDCHGSDFGTVRGPHGSSYRHILRRPYTASPAPRRMISDEACFACHSFDAYANPSASSSVRAASRFNKPGVDKGHAEHVGEENVPCYACHVTHGSTTLPNLLVTGRFPGLSSYTANFNGGTCGPTCHESESYTVNYAR
jgi:predicted CXXCH cytochrome family protein